MSEAHYGEVAALSGTVQAYREDARLTTALSTIEGLRANYAVLRKIRAMALTMPVIKGQDLLNLIDEAT